MTAILPAPQPAMADECAAGEGFGAGPLPPMGWNGWNTFECGEALNQQTFRANADALVERGLQAAGYAYVNLDDCWQAGRGADGALLTNTARFPDGIGALGAYVHQKGLKLGINSSVGGCPRPDFVTPGSYGHEAADAALFADFGVDYVKYNACGGDRSTTETSFRAMRDALEQQARPMLLSIVDAPFKYWHTQVGQLWRTQGDVQPNWQGVLDIIDATTAFAAYAGQGGYNDSDMLWIGNGLTDSEARACFSMWSLLASPLLAGNDLTTMTEATRRILTQPDVIALNQDPLRLQGVLLARQGDVMVYAKPLAQCGARGVVLLNRGDEAASGSISWKELGLGAGSATVQDLWAGSESVVQDSVTMTVAPHDAVALRIVGKDPPLPRGKPYLSDLSWSYAANGVGPVERDREVGDAAAADGASLSLGGRAYGKGLGTHAPALVRYRLGKRCQELAASVGIDDSTNGAGSVVFQVWADGEKLFDSGIMGGDTPPQDVRVPLTGRSELRLWVGQVDDTDADRADWADARLRCDE